jgi:recombination associated protein RdgC
VSPDRLVHELSGCARFALGKEERILPKTVVKQILAERILSLESQGQTIKRSQKAQMMEELEFELLPKAFCHQKRLDGLFDFKNQILFLNSASASQVSQCLALLRKSIPGIHIQPLEYPENLMARFNEWILHPNTLPAPFELASHCLLVCLDNEKKQVNYKGYEFPAVEINQALEEGMAVSEISLRWHDRIELTLTHHFVLKRLKCLDYLVDEFNEIGKLGEAPEQQDAALALLSGELRALTQDLLKILKEPRKHLAESEEACLA